MKQILLSGVALAAMLTSASAADIPAYAPPRRRWWLKPAGPASTSVPMPAGSARTAMARWAISATSTLKARPSAARPAITGNPAISSTASKRISVSPRRMPVRTRSRASTTSSAPASIGPARCAAARATFSAITCSTRLPVWRARSWNSTTIRTSTRMSCSAGPWVPASNEIRAQPLGAARIPLFRPRQRELHDSMAMTSKRRCSRIRCASA